MARVEDQMDVIKKDEVMCGLNKTEGEIKTMKH